MITDADIKRMDMVFAKRFATKDDLINFKDSILSDFEKT